MEMALPQAVRLEEAIAEADGSSGWVVTLCAGAGWFAGFLPPTLARAVVATPGMCLAGSGAATGVAEREGDGWRITGRWGHATGAPHATHFTFNAVLHEGGQPLRDAAGAPRVRAFIVLATGVQVLPTWAAIGLRARASHTSQIRDLVVPDTYAFDIEPSRQTLLQVRYCGGTSNGQKRGAPMIEGLVAGKVYGRPEQRVGNNSGKAFVTAKVRAATGGGETLFVNVLAFDATAQAALLALTDGDAVSLAGTLTPKVWTDREGQPRPAVDMIASHVLTAYHVKRKRDAVGSAEPAHRHSQAAAAAPAPAPRQSPLPSPAAAEADGWPASD